MMTDQNKPEQESKLSPTSDSSPIRPQHPDPVRPRVSPNIARPMKPALPTGDLPTIEPQEQDRHAEEAIERLRDKMAQVAQEYADGKLNQAQFNAIYRRYSEQREITQRLLERNPESEAWQSVVKPGHTSFLRDHFAAKITSYGLYRLQDGQQITLQGQVRLPQAQLMPIFARIKQAVEGGHILNSARRPLKDGSWVIIIPGRLTVSVVLFSLEPAVIQRKMVEDAHYDFERANEKTMRRNDFSLESLVFPHRALMDS
jgi:hypothetical protein